ncbi:hypothetical protein AGMMS49965_26510 [Bacteroidia bacterium]|nr:hypothetical protein AGMMS49965_26510 [Bacteroidia bacterium]
MVFVLQRRCCWGTGVANAAETIGSWTSGSTTVVLTDDGVLTVSGTGAMANYPSPWNGTSIKTLVINEGVTSIGDGAFSGCSRLTSVTIPDLKIRSFGRLFQHFGYAKHSNNNKKTA